MTGTHTYVYKDSRLSLLYAMFFWSPLQGGGKGAIAKKYNRQHFLEAVHCAHLQSFPLPVNLKRRSFAFPSQSVDKEEAASPTKSQLIETSSFSQVRRAKLLTSQRTYFVLKSLQSALL